MLGPDLRQDDLLEEKDAGGEYVGGRGAGRMVSQSGKGSSPGCRFVNSAPVPPGNEAGYDAANV